MRKLDTQRATQVLFVHGAGGGAWEWNIWQRMFRASGWDAHVLELQPCAAGIAATRLDDYVAQVECRARALLQPVLIGASLGGLLALVAAPRIEPRALVLVNPLPPGFVLPRAGVREYPDVVRWGSRRSLASTRRAMPGADDAARLYAHRRWCDESGAVLREAAGGVAVAGPQCPVLVLASEHDGDVPSDVSRALAARQGAEFHLLQGASHVGPLLGRDAHAAAALALGWVERALRPF